MFDPIGVARPNAGEKICLQLKPNRQPIGFRFTAPTARCIHAIGNAKQFLHVMSNFVRNNVGLCKIASCTQAFLKLTGTQYE